MPKTVLIVDDDPDAREIYGSALAAAGYRVATAVHGAEGVHLARRLRPQLILMDLRMPLMDGRYSLQYIRSDRETRLIPVWAVSAYLDEDETGLDEGISFNRLLAKPIEPDRLVEAVSDFLGTN